MVDRPGRAGDRPVGRAFPDPVAGHVGPLQVPLGKTSGLRRPIGVHVRGDLGRGDIRRGHPHRPHVPHGAVALPWRLTPSPHWLQLVRPWRLSCHLAVPDRRGQPGTAFKIL
jgi:hypothetical protein